MGIYGPIMENQMDKKTENKFKLCYLGVYRVKGFPNGPLQPHTSVGFQRPLP